MSADFGIIYIKVRLPSATFSISVEFGPGRSECLSNFGDFGRGWPDVDQHWSEFDRAAAISAKLGRSSTHNLSSSGTPQYLCGARCRCSLSTDNMNPHAGAVLRWPLGCGNWGCRWGRLSARELLDL